MHPGRKSFLVLRVLLVLTIRPIIVCISGRNHLAGSTNHDEHCIIACQRHLCTAAMHKTLHQCPHIAPMSTQHTSLSLLLSALARKLLIL